MAAAVHNKLDGGRRPRQARQAVPHPPNPGNKLPAEGQYRSMIPQLVLFLSKNRSSIGKLCGKIQGLMRTSGTLAHSHSLYSHQKHEDRGAFPFMPICDPLIEHNDLGVASTSPRTVYISNVRPGFLPSASPSMIPVATRRMSTASDSSSSARSLNLKGGFIRPVGRYNASDWYACQCGPKANDGRRQRPQPVPSPQAFVANHIYWNCLWRGRYFRCLLLFRMYPPRERP
jgi:hypothetical protein